MAGARDRMRRLTTLTALAIVGCAVNPATGARELSLVSESQEIAMGQQEDPKAAAFFGIYPDEALQKYVSDLGLEMAALSERPQLPWTFRLADDPAVNAFAIPGGFIYVTRGIMVSLNSEAELAGVLGHEVGHITARHSANQMSRQQLQQIGLVAGMVLSEHVRQYGGVLAQGLAVLNLSYSRGDESQADELGVRYMTRSGHDARELMDVMQTLALVSGGASERVPEWQLTHPYPENREANLQALIAESGVDYSGSTVDRDPYLRRLEGLVFGTNPREGFFKESRFHHPDLAFRLDFPDGWRGVNQKTVVGSVSPQEDALIALSVAQDATSPTAALTEFRAQEGVESRNAREIRFNGLPAAMAEFAASTDGGVLQGYVAYVAHGELVYQLLGYSAQASWSRHAETVQASFESFQEERDRAVLNVQPARVEIVEAPRRMTFAEFLTAYPSTVDDAEISRINRLQPEEAVAAGTLLKRVRGGELP
jgi:predicted Zn-dependent protease